MTLPQLTSSSTVSAGAAGALHYLKVLHQLLGLHLEVHLIHALVSLQQLLIGELKGDPAARSYIDRDCEFLQLPPRGPEWEYKTMSAPTDGTAPPVPGLGFESQPLGEDTFPL